MPEMNGIELATAIRLIPEFEKTPLIFLTGNTSREYVLNAIKVGANDFVVKPANHDDLMAKAMHYLG
jgi:putative two-component system response regulator